MKFLIYKKLEDGSYAEKMGSYESDFKDDTSANRSHLQAEPNASHFAMPDGADEDCVDAVLVEEQVIPAVMEEDIEVSPEQVIPAHYAVQENADKVLAKRQAKANANLDAIRALRQPLLDAADHEINTMEDDSVDATAMRTYRKSLRECTESLKKVSGDAKLTLENTVPSEFVFPVKP